jgi:hypothetical protein
MVSRAGDHVVRTGKERREEREPTAFERAMRDGLAVYLAAVRTGASREQALAAWEDVVCEAMWELRKARG